MRNNDKTTNTNQMIQRRDAQQKDKNRVEYYVRDNTDDTRAGWQALGKVPEKKENVEQQYKEPNRRKTKYFVSWPAYRYSTEKRFCGKL